ncbi:hypothetical protein [Streptomyces jumonjinensis]|uniref:hypothetical protein n=1 Tax=Streptomyces jumonjinensis TaxID=1945 RepID=UPI00188690C9|nr:hypothetical protein [Streptomyces jumonjinensis]
MVHLTTVDVADADITLLAVFADALDRAACPSPGPEFGTLAEALGELGQDPDCPWPVGDGATVACWVRQALSLVLHSPFEGARGAADHEMLSAVLRRAGDGDHVTLDQDEAEALGRVMLSMVRAASGDPPRWRRSGLGGGARRRRARQNRRRALRTPALRWIGYTYLYGA